MTAQEQTKAAKWTIMVYIAADDMLANFAVGSLLQLRRVASENDGVVVTAQFDADGRRNIPRLVFDGKGTGAPSITTCEKEVLPSGTPMTTPLTLSRFIDWTYKHYKADHYCLVLWGHGPELLIEDNLVVGNKQRTKKFLTPADLGKALADTALRKDGRKLDLVAIDACCMSTVEVACELPAYANFLIASQEDVPDFSFPYDQMLVFDPQGGADEVERLCEEIPLRYVRGYEDYVLTKETEIASITLSGLSLRALETVTRPLRRLADALLRGVHDEKKRQAVVCARAKYQGYVAGLYTDLYEFCNQLQIELQSAKIIDEEINSACKEICAAIEARDENAVIVANQAPQDKRCRGISIYFPYSAPGTNIAESPAAVEATNVVRKNGVDPLESLSKEAGTEDRMKKTNAAGTEGLEGDIDPLSEGGMSVLSKGGMSVLSKGGMSVLSKGGISVLSMEVLDRTRRERIEETEQYYCDLKLSKTTRWGEFIRYCWSRWLAEEVEARMISGSVANASETLDGQYSAQQCAMNLLSLCRELEKEQKADVGQGADRPSDGKSSFAAHS